jgi:hypothetical protein
MNRLQGIEKRGPSRRKAGWRLNISNIPTPIGDELDRLWRGQCVDAIKSGFQPIGWHQFVIFAWKSYINSVQTPKERLLMEEELAKFNAGTRD